jgi:hypothetical protein
MYRRERELIDYMMAAFETEDDASIDESSETEEET